MDYMTSSIREAQISNSSGLSVAPFLAFIVKGGAPSGVVN